MPLFLSLILLLSVFIAPAIAIYPRFLQRPMLACAIPIVSSLIIFCIAAALIVLGRYTPFSVNGINIVLIITAIVRSVFFYKKNNFLWTREDFFILGINFVILFPLVVMAYYSSFYTNDEVYSWGLWATQHYQSRSPTYQITGSVYPQLFPIVISYCFKLVGTLEFQSAVKIAFLVFPLTMLQVIATASKKTISLIPFYCFVAFFSVFPGDFYFFYSKAYADPMMIASLLVSVLFFISYFSKEEKRDPFLWLAVACGVTASLTKQPALWWAIVVFPIWLTVKMFRGGKINSVEFCAMMAMAYPGLLWLASTGFNTFKNPGVINASMQHRDLFEQFYYAFERYVINTPSILILLISAMAASFKKRIIAGLFFVLVIPYTLMWFMCGAYQLRLGVHVTALCGLLIASSDYLGFQFSFSRRFKIVTAVSVLFFSVAISIGYFIKLRYFNDFLIYPMQGGRTTLNRFYGDEGDAVYARLYHNPAIKIWVGDPFNYGVFYGHTELLYPDDYFLGNYKARDFLKDIETYLPDYVMTPGQSPSHFSGIAEKVIASCPFLFKKIASANQGYGFIVYELNKNKVKKKTCDVFLFREKRSK